MKISVMILVLLLGACSGEEGVKPVDSGVATDATVEAATDATSDATMDGASDATMDARDGSNDAAADAADAD